jgi:hypothetical protein
MNPAASSHRPALLIAAVAVSSILLAAAWADGASPAPAALPATPVIVAPPAFPADSIGRGTAAAPAGYERAAPLCDQIIVYHEPRGERLASEIGRIACNSAASIAAELGLERLTPVTIVIARDTGGFRRLHGGQLPEWGEAFAEMGRAMIGIDASRVIASPRPLRTVVAHELSHVLFDQRVRGARAPFWLVEGLAMRQSGEWTLEDEWNLARSVWAEKLPWLEDLEGPFPRATGRAETAYRVSHAAVDFLLEGRPEAIVTLTAFLRDTGDFERAFLLTFGETPGDFSARFRVRLERRYHTAGAVLNASPYWLSVACLFLLVYAVKRYRTARKVAEWERAEWGDGPAERGDGPAEQPPPRP